MLLRISHHAKFCHFIKKKNQSSSYSFTNYTQVCTNMARYYMKCVRMYFIEHNDGRRCQVRGSDPWNLRTILVLRS